ncbi:MAG: uracil-DNA glycosylase family protein [Spirochaetia bacterium]
MNNTQQLIINAAKELSENCGALTFTNPVTHVYNPLSYARNGYEQYVRLLPPGKKSLLFVGMNPGPWGMAQTGVPFGEIESVREWMGIETSISEPEKLHPKRPVEGFNCSRREVSGKRFWGLMKKRYGSASDFFNTSFTANYCPLLFFQDDGKNRTPDKLCKEEREALFRVCSSHLASVIKILDPDWIIGIGKFAFERVKELMQTGSMNRRVLCILHPSPANPHANIGWDKAVTEKLKEAGIWT